MASSSTYNYQYGGSLRADHPTYTTRKADSDLWEKLNAGQYCYVLNARQMGKSSLMLQTKKRLEEQGFACVTISLEGIGKDNVTHSDWYNALFESLIKRFDLAQKVNYKIWWKQQEGIPVTQRLLDFINEILFVHIQNEKIFIFFDEIDMTLGLNFCVDDFFAWIRVCCNRRAENPNYNRLTFALFGVATLSELMRENDRFNIIGKSIELTGFDISETPPLARGLIGKVQHPKNTLQAILDWTGGQPFLTQRICNLVAKSDFFIALGEEQKKVEQIVRSKIIENWRSNDSHRHLEGMLIRVLHKDKRKIRRLELYKRILQKGAIEIEKNAESRLESISLKLSGLVKQDKGTLKIYNRIYESIFNLDWVQKQLADIRPYDTKLEAWLASKGQDQSQLLYGKELHRVLQWKKDRNLSQQDNDFLSESAVFDGKAKAFLANISYYESVIKAIVDWTGGLKSLNEKIFDCAGNSAFLPRPGRESEWVEQFVQTYFLENWETQEPFKTIRDRVLNPEGLDSFCLLANYQQILRETLSTVENNPEQQELLNLGLVVRQENTLKVANRIYQSIFNPNWTDAKLAKLRPYARQFTAWLNSQKQDEAHLLQGQELQEAIAFGGGQYLQLQEQQFLIASQVLNLHRGVRNSHEPGAA